VSAAIRDAFTGFEILGICVIRVKIKVLGFSFLAEGNGNILTGIRPVKTGLNHPDNPVNLSGVASAKTDPV
jgi:hypothetical protein